MLPSGVSETTSASRVPHATERCSHVGERARRQGVVFHANKAGAGGRGEGAKTILCATPDTAFEPNPSPR